MQAWAEHELRDARLGDARVNRRLMPLVVALAAQPTASVPQARGSRAATKGAYRFWRSERVTPDAIRAAQYHATVERIRAYSLVLVIQDTTELNVTHHLATHGLGLVDNASQQGVKVHSAPAVSSDGVPLGLIHHAGWVRDPATRGNRHRWRQRATTDKERQRWLTAQAATQQVVPPDVAMITVADREADIYDVFAAPRQPGDQLPIRATHHRRVNHAAGYLWQAIRCSPMCGHETIAVPRTNNRAPRQVPITYGHVAGSGQSGRPARTTGHHARCLSPCARHRQASSPPP
ncbi:IS4 family transposase [Chloroflexus aurantiacus]